LIKNKIIIELKEISLLAGRFVLTITQKFRKKLRIMIQNKRIMLTFKEKSVIVCARYIA